MAENDIYGSKERYERFRLDLNSITEPKLKIKGKRGANRKYICRNPKNLEYFRQLMGHFDARDTSYIRRIRVLQSMTLICDALTKDLSSCDRADMNSLMAKMHEVYKTPISKQTFVKDVRFIWKTLFPEKDVQGRSDETIVPYPVRHLKPVFDKSKLKLRTDKINLAEFEQIINYFGRDRRIQAYLALALESLGRPQEILYRKIENVELFDNFAKVFITEHGKEGPGLLQCIEATLTF